MKERMERLCKYMEYRRLNDNQVTTACGLSNGILNKARRGVNDLSIDTIEKVLKHYSDLNRDWLIAGEGEMLKSSALNVVENTTNHGRITQTATVNGGELGEVRLENERLKAENAILKEQYGKLLELLARGR